MEPIAPPIYQDSFGFALLLDDREGSTLFPSPLANNMVTGYFPGAERTAVFIHAGRRQRAAGWDFVNRLAAFTVIAGHKPYAFRVILQGNWDKRVASRFLAAIKEAAKKSGIGVVLPHLEDSSSLSPTAAAIVWADKGQGTPVAPIEEGDEILCAAEVNSVRLDSYEPKDLKAFSNWGAIVTQLWTVKYSHKPKVVRFATCLMNIGITEIQDALSIHEQRYCPSLDQEVLKNMLGKAGVIVVCAPHFSGGVKRRLVHLNRRAEVAIIGNFVRDERGDE